MRLNLLSGLLLLLFIGGCGSGSEKETSTDSISIKQNESLSLYSNTLSIDQKTPEGVGTLIYLNLDIKRTVGLCTWFLVGKNRALTNSHCIPEALKNDGSIACSEHMHGTFQTGSGPVNAKCKSLLYYSALTQSTIISNDYALIELDRNIENASYFTLDRKGFTENEKVKILSMNHNYRPQGVFSSFREHTCLMKSSDLFGKISTPGSSPLIGFMEEGSQDYCKTIPGNSGSPVLNSSGSLVGIVHGGLNSEVNHNQSTPGTTSKISSDFSMITNLRCQKFYDLSLDKNTPVTCASENKNSRLDQEALKQSIQPKVKKLIDEALMKQPSYFEYDVSTKSYGNFDLITIRPRCIKSSKLWNKEDLSKEKKIKVSITQYRMSFPITIDYYGNLRVETQLVESGASLLDISGLKSLERKKEVISVMDTTLLGYVNTLEVKIPLCGN